jgi:hypothetical protein
MTLQTRALYNLLRLNAAEDPSVNAEPWALEDLRELSSEELFARLAKAHIRLDKTSFIQYASQCDTPEDLADLLLDEEEEQYDRFYLIFFELWRRFLPERQSLSIFCDELDHRISLYHFDALQSDEPIQDGLGNLLEILEENTDAGGRPEEVFELVTNYCAHDLSAFIYDYIANLLDEENEVYASELIEGFAPYITGVIEKSEIGQGGSPDFLAGTRDIAKGKDRSEDKKDGAKPTQPGAPERRIVFWGRAQDDRFLNHERYRPQSIWFEFLAARLAFFTDAREANQKIHRILGKQLELSLLMEILLFLASGGEHELFVSAVKKVLPLLQTQEQFLEVMEIGAEYYRLLDRDEQEQAIQKMIQAVSGKNSLSDSDRKAFSNLIIK